jgi:hypothetical protein
VLTRLPRPLLYALVAVICAAGLAAAHGSRIRSNWHERQWEDGLFFQDDADQIHSLWDCFAKTGVWPGRYLPLTTNLYYHVGSRAWANRIEAYHFINLLMIVLNAVLLYRLANNFLGAWWAMIPALLFASRLAIVEMVLHTCEFQGLLYASFTILAVDLFIRSRKTNSATDSTRLLVLSASAFGLALLSKEAAIVLPALLIVYGRLFDDRFSSRPYLVHPLVGIVWALLFVMVLPAHGQSIGGIYDLSAFNLLRNYAAYGLIFSNWILTPLQDFIMPIFVAGFVSTLPVRLVLGALIVAEGAVLLFPKFLKNQDLRLVAFGFAWFLIATLPFAVFADRLFMRYGYLGHAGLALCVVGLIKAAVGLLRTARPVAPPEISENAQVA